MDNSILERSAVTESIDNGAPVRTFLKLVSKCNPEISRVEHLYFRQMLLKIVTYLPPDLFLSDLHGENWLTP
jgi:hypothetical protein